MRNYLFLALVALPLPAMATDWDHGLFGGNAIYGPAQIQRERDINNYKPPRTIRHVEKHHIHKTPRDDNDGTRVQGWVKLNPRVASCFAAIRTVGDQHLTTEGAKNEAVKAWSQQARHDIGERAMDFETAREGSFACVRSSIGSALGQVFHRCEVIARPCTAPHVERER